jgi:hypothetical protein
LVVNKGVGAEGEKSFALFGPVHGGDFSAERLDKLDGQCADAAARTVEEHAAVRAEPEKKTQGLKRQRAGLGERRRIGEGKALGDGRERPGISQDIIGKAAPFAIGEIAENGIAGGEGGDARAPRQCRQCRRRECYGRDEMGR